ncbi:hypothetical protein [Streptomyces sp. NPDC004788]
MAEDPQQGGVPVRRLGEVAALISAMAAVAGILLGVFGVPSFHGASTAHSPAGSGPPVATTAAPSATSPLPSPSLPALPKGWHRVREADLTTVFAVPDGWTRTDKNAIQSGWASRGGTYEIVVKRDTSYGPTAQAAAEGQLAWYRKETESSMAGLRATTHSTRQGGRDAVWLELDYHWRGQTTLRKRVEVFVAGDAGRVYQLLVDTTATGNHLAGQRELFEAARMQLITDVE